MTILFLYYSPFLLISFILSLFFPTMMTFCKKSVHSFLGLDHQETNLDFKSRNLHRNVWTARPVVDIDENDLKPSEYKTINLVNTAKAEPCSAALQVSWCSKRNPGGIGFIDDMGGGVNGLMSCTESLGFESCDGRSADNVLDGDIQISTSARNDDRGVYGLKRMRRKKVCREVKKFPPPLSSCNFNGHPNFYLRSERKDGRLQLTEVKIQRKEIFRATRENGRLTLHLLADEEELDAEVIEQELDQQQGEEDEQGPQEEDGEVGLLEVDEEVTMVGGVCEFPTSSGEGFSMLEGDKLELEEEPQQKQEKVQQETVAGVWKFATSNDEGFSMTGDEEVGLVKVDEQVRNVAGMWNFPGSGGEGLSRCYAVVNHHPIHLHHHHLLWRRQHCLTTG